MALILADRATLAGVIGTMFLFSVGVGAAAPAALVQAISVNPRVTGSASGLYGSMQMVVGAALVALAGLGRNPALSSATVLVLSRLLAQLSFWLAVREPAAAGAEEVESAATP
jgi:DHA1 family bicyclomycin/chloramphenicol resistance-like MFS transporter